MDNNYWITGYDHFLLMHRIERADIKLVSDFCVGEAFQNENGYWEIRIGVYSDLKGPGQILIGISDSPLIAREVLWEQRNLMHWGIYQ
jgi:hypothetical protein